MNRRSFLQTVAGALIAARLALEFGAEKPQQAQEPVGYAGWEFVEDPMPMRFVMNENGCWDRVPEFISAGEPMSVNPAWQNAQHEYIANWPMGGVPQPRNRAVKNPYA